MFASCHNEYADYSSGEPRRFAKRKLDDYKFLGNLLEVSYAPQYETLSDTRDKLEERRRTVLNRIRGKLSPQISFRLKIDGCTT